jgi:hypothetical protein
MQRGLSLLLDGKDRLPFGTDSQFGVEVAFRVAQFERRATLPVEPETGSRLLAPIAQLQCDVSTGIEAEHGARSAVPVDHDETPGQNAGRSGRQAARRSTARPDEPPCDAKHRGGTQ